MRYRILGNGYIGNYLLKHLPDATMDMGRILGPEDVQAILAGAQPDEVLINCIGKTGRPNIDWCEDHRAETAQANIMVPYWIANECQKTGRHWIHIGSGCIYDGYEREWSEMDPPNFYGSLYAITKAVSQSALAGFRDVLILRIRMPIDEDMHERCYISKLIKYTKECKGLFNAKNSMTYLKDLVHVIKTLASVKATGTFNVVNPGPLTAEELLEIYAPGTKAIIEPKETVIARLKAKRSNCILSIDKLEMLGIRLPELGNRIREIVRANATKE
jgi:3,5-epimerase/4-reductase